MLRNNTELSKEHAVTHHNNHPNHKHVIFEHTFEQVPEAPNTGTVPDETALVGPATTRHYGGVEQEEALEIIGRLIKDARLEKGLRQQPFAKFAEVDTKTLASMEKGTRVPWETNQRKVEKALGWRAGSIQELLDNASATPKESVTLDSMQEGAAAESWQDLADAENGRIAEQEQPVTRAAQLTDEELLAELSYRFRNYKNRFLGEA